jgi:hypothetical protein
MQAKILYSESGKKAMDEYLEGQKKQTERKIYEAKYVFGDDEVEITASDVKKTINHTFQNERRIVAKRRLLFILETYIVLGILLVLTGTLYPLLLEMFESRPLQFMLITIGSSLTLAGCFSWLYLYKRYRSNKNKMQ